MARNRVQCTNEASKLVDAKGPQAVCPWTHRAGPMTLWGPDAEPSLDGSFHKESVSTSKKDDKEAKSVESKNRANISHNAVTERITRRPVWDTKREREGEAKNPGPEDQEASDKDE